MTEDQDTMPAYEKPSITTYTEEEVLESMEAWGVSGTGPGS